MNFNGQAINQLNELEWAEGYIWANVWHDDHIYQIDPSTGIALRRWDLSALRQSLQLENREAVLNGIAWDGQLENGIAKISRSWANGDVVSLTMPMKLKTSQWYDFATSVERGPLVFALRVEDEWREKDRGDKFGVLHEVYPKSNWNYALYFKDLENLEQSFTIEEHEWDGEYPWNLDNSPISLKARGISMPEWKLSPNGVPQFPAWWGSRDIPENQIKFDQITLVPYGCTTLRITEFPVYGMF